MKESFSSIKLVREILLTELGNTWLMQIETDLFCWSSMQDLMKMQCHSCLLLIFSECSENFVPKSNFNFSWNSDKLKDRFKMVGCYLICTKPLFFGFLVKYIVRTIFANLRKNSYKNHWQSGISPFWMGNTLQIQT